MSSLSHSTVLSDLCAICHANPQKYTCPRCACHTCSLPCVKRHKEWAQCSGIRDPAAYRKRGELETPASIDQDFNFITSVERSLERADDDAAGRGIQLVPSNPRKRKFETKSRWERDAEARGVRVVKAPAGLSRSKLNKTQWNGTHNCISWSVEWVTQDGKGQLKHFIDNAKTVEEAYNYTFKKASTRKKSRHGGSNGKASIQDSNDADVKPDILDKDTAITTTTNDEVASEKPHLYFYLHRPLTASKSRCLIPIKSNQKLEDIIQGRTLLEFPTIYVLDIPIEKQPDTFITEAQYETMHDDVPIELVPRDLEEGELMDDSVEPLTLPSDLSTSKVLEILQKDLLK